MLAFDPAVGLKSSLFSESYDSDAPFGQSESVNGHASTAPNFGHNMCVLPATHVESGRRDCYAAN